MFWRMAVTDNPNRDASMTHISLPLAPTCHHTQRQHLFHSFLSEPRSTVVPLCVTRAYNTYKCSIIGRRKLLQRSHFGPCTVCWLLVG